MKKSDICGGCKKPQAQCTCAQDGKGAKFDKDKLRWDLYPIEQSEKVVDILTHGAKKYAPNNWKGVENGRERYYSAMMRHLTAWRKGELIDPDSGLTHLAHAACNLTFLMWWDDNKSTETKGSKPRKQQ